MTYKAAVTNIVGNLVSYQFKKDIPKDIPKNNPRLILRVDFGLHGYRFVLRGPSGLLMRDGSEMPVHVAHIIGVGPVIGPKDLEAAKHRSYAQAWRESYAETINERLALA